MRGHAKQALTPFLLTFALGCAGDSASRPVFAHEFPAVSIGAYSELSSLCQSWTLGNDEPLYVNAVSMTAGPAWHHSNWFYVPDSLFNGPDGTWGCGERNFDEYTAAIAGGVLFAQSTQARSEVQQFADGAVLVLPPHTKVVGNIHLLNATEVAIEKTTIRLELRGLREPDVQIRLKPMSFVYRPLDLPPNSRSKFEGNCDVAAKNNGSPIDFSIYYVLPHYHTLGEGMQFDAIDENGSARLVFENFSKIGEPLGETFDPPIGLAGTTDLRFSCSFNNPTGSQVGWGIGDQEMCVFLAFTDSPYTWAGGVFGSNQVLGPDADGVVENTGPCDAFKI